MMVVVQRCVFGSHCCTPTPLYMPLCHLQAAPRGRDEKSKRRGRGELRKEARKMTDEERGGGTRDERTPGRSEAVKR